MPDASLNRRFRMAAIVLLHRNITIWRDEMSQLSHMLPKDWRYLETIKRAGEIRRP
jgi:hypothetical protein